MKVDFAKIKATTDIVAVVESYGVKLTASGNDHLGLCPFHEEQTPSFRVTRAKGLYHCFGCGVAGNVIQFVARKENISDREAGLKLCRAVPGVQTASALPTATTTPTIAPTSTPTVPALSSAESAKLLGRVVAWYAKTLHKDRAGLEYLRSRKLGDLAMLDSFQVGYSNGTLASVLPKQGEILDQLKALGVLNDKGHEHFYGCVTVPLFDGSGNVVGIYGRRAGDSNPHHLYMAGPRKGLWNATAAKGNQTLLVAESILDGMALWQDGFKNVIAVYGTNGWTSDHAQLLKTNGTAELILCLDNDNTGRDATERLKKELASLVKSIKSITWPDGVKDACDFFLSHTPEEFKGLLESLNPQPPPASAGPTVQQGSQDQVTMTGDGLNVSYQTRRYELRAVEKSGASRLKATIRAVGDQGRFVIDTVDFYLSRSRRGFMTDVARLFHETVDVIERDVNKIIGHLEAFTAKDANTAPVVLVSDADKAEGLKLGRNANLTGELLRDMERLGAIGESANKLIGYLVMTSRKLADPLAMLILSGSGAGKSHLQDTVLSFCPDEDLIKLTSLTDRALFYKGEDSLKNKVLAVEELAGAQGADYAIRNLISARKLVIESTVKNPLTGKLETQVNTVRGPTAVFQTTTNPRTDAETRSRFILVSVDESAEQTRAILEAQRQSHTLQGWRQRQAREAILRRHHAFQRLLRPLTVVNPFEPFLTYPTDQLLVRRDQPKYLTLILAVTFLHQLQRPLKHDPDLGEYIETTLDDIAVANDLAHRLFGHSLDDLSGPSRNLLGLIADHVAKKAGGGPADKISFNRRELREAFKWGDTRLRIHLEELVEMEYVVPLSGRFGQTYQYRLLYTPTDEPGRFLAGLKSVEQLRQEANLAGILPNLAPTSQGAMCEVQNAEKACNDRLLANIPANLAPFSGEHIPELHERNGSLITVQNGEDHP